MENTFEAALNAEPGPNSLATAFLDEAQEAQERDPYGFAILMGLNVTGKHIYGGTVPEAEKARRRKANKVARESRRKNRG